MCDDLCKRKNKYERTNVREQDIVMDEREILCIVCDGSEEWMRKMRVKKRKNLLCVYAF